MKAPEIVIFQSKRNKNFYFRVLAKNGEKVCQSEGYTTKAMCKKGLKVLSAILASPDTFSYDASKRV